MTLEQRAIEFFLKQEVLKFGDFTLKSGRKSPYFFNTGSLCTAAQLATMGELYAAKLQAEKVFDNANVVFKKLPAYKGIPTLPFLPLSRLHRRVLRFVLSATGKKLKLTATKVTFWEF